MHLSDECAQDNNSIHAPVMMVARVLLYFFKIVSANLKKKLLNTPWSALFATRSNVTCSKVPQQSGGALSATMAHEQAKKRLNSRTPENSWVASVGLSHSLRNTARQQLMD